MNQPPVFISCVSPEFRQTRSRVAAILMRLGYTPVIQEILGTEPGDLRQVLRDKIDACEGLIQIVGHGYGAEPPTVDANYRRVSYTQFEFLYARSQKKKTWILFVGDACTRDTALERLDLPNDPAHPDPTGYQADRRALQLAYCDERKKDGHLYHTATSDTDLELKVERLRDELAQLRQAFNLWQNRVLNAFAVVFVLLVLIGGSVWWFGYRQHGDIQQFSAEARHITREKIRAQLLESAERVHQAALAEAAKARGWEERQRLSKAAEQANAGRLSRIDELADSFAEIEGTNRSTDIFDEMTRILAEEGVDQAIAYASSQRPGIMEKVKARAAAAREKNRAELLPLLKSAQLQADRNHPGEADSLFADILALEPDWPDARNAFAWFLIQQGIMVEPAKGNVMLRKAAEICQGTLALNQRAESPQSWAMTQNNLGGALKQLGTRSGAEEGRELLQDALAAYRSALEVYTKADLPKDWAMTQNNLGNALEELGTRSGAELGRKLLQDGLAAYRSVLEVYTKADSPQSWAMTQNNLGNALYELGTRSGAEQGRKLLEEALAAYRSAVEVYTKAHLPQDWAMTQNNLGNALKELGTRSAGEEGRKLLEEALVAYRSALEVRIRADLPQDWAAAQNNLGNALKELGTRSAGEEGRKLLEEALVAYRSALEVKTRADLPQDWAATQYNLGNALKELGTRRAGEEGRKLLEEALAAYRFALEVRTRADLPQDWAATQNNLGNALQELGTRSAGEEGRKLLEEALAAYHSALEVYNKSDMPQLWAITQNNLGIALLTLGKKLGGDEGLKRKQEAVELLRDVVSYQPDDLGRYRLAVALGGLAFDLVLSSQFAEARTQCEDAQRLANEIGDGVKKSDRDSLIFIQQNLAHALLLQGHYDEALAIYRQNWDKPLHGKTFGEITLEDFAAFDKAGLSHADLSRMEQALSDLTSKSPSP
jgi:tetratricopeptide (TPR) repeat protein